MERRTEYRGKNLNVYITGDPSRPALVLLHGYLETGKIWEEFCPLLERDYYMVCPDIPGHGKSELLGSVHRMDDISDALYHVLRDIVPGKFHLAGHSMGGYIALAFREKYPELLLSLTLFHSTCFADSQEKKANRDREISLIHEGKKELIVNLNIPRAFADDNLESLQDKINAVKTAALSNPDDGIIALLKGMKSRPDRCSLFMDDSLPLLVIAGRKDNYIPMEVIEKLKNRGTNVEFRILENSGHMGFIEEPGNSARFLHEFCSSLS